ncbi:methyltransferase domain-containing protein [Pseudohongiella sp.]|uniref:Methyltransferase domain-containing protein n=1 Tax=marine sediment metagenome TaxID=412755 RepID=A0A0F9Z6C1_9ZZZZ|nr:methyltransferase domain-containing protein [Pseudohongiella sp.]HDZ09483.1 methyltransferase domain-containing protein [Pseudohongiella sp.]HEA63945.1 methyltransferase domain-containing protein [Pseudohongiella sp.]
MSHEDREKWQRKYREGAYASRHHASVYLQQHLPTLAPPLHRALDLACGAGRNALFLARQGYQVDAVDIAAEGLARGKTSADDEGLDNICWYEHDLDAGLPVRPDQYGLIIMIRYLDIALLRAATQHLVKGGYVLAEVHLQTDVSVTGPGSKRFRVAPGTLASVADDLDMIDYSEGVTTDPDGSVVALARLLARKR